MLVLVCVYLTTTREHTSLKITNLWFLPNLLSESISLDGEWFPEGKVFPGLTYLGFAVKVLRWMYFTKVSNVLVGKEVCVMSATAGSQGAFKERSPTHPHLGGLKVKALRFYGLERKKQPESASLTRPRALVQLRKRDKKWEGRW